MKFSDPIHSVSETSAVSTINKVFRIYNHHKAFFSQTVQDSTFIIISKHFISFHYFMKCVHCTWACIRIEILHAANLIFYFNLICRRSQGNHGNTKLCFGCGIQSAVYYYASASKVYFINIVHQSIVKIFVAKPKELRLFIWLTFLI